MYRKAGYAPVMNDTKWDELRLAMYELSSLSPKWRTRNLENSYICDWDGEWYYHFRNGGYETIEWVDIRVDNPEQRDAVRRELARVHVPGEETAHGFRVYGHVLEGQTIDYIAL
jgi:hypothetical protein